jgi:hypothetical protein
MGWFTVDRQHEGWAARVAADERSSSFTIGEGMFAGQASAGHQRDVRISNQSLVPDKEIIGWRGACTCGWMGSLWEREANPAGVDSEGGRDRICLDGVANASRKIEDAIHDEWRAHLQVRRYPVAAVALAAVQAAAREYEQASERLNSAVADARAAGASWAKVGEAAGCSRQSAYKRWAESNSVESR